jgi:hypothetical protein
MSNGSSAGPNISEQKVSTMTLTRQGSRRRIRILDRAYERIDVMLAATAQNEVRALPNDVFRRHALPGALFSDDTVEVV